MPTFDINQISSTLIHNQHGHPRAMQQGNKLYVGGVRDNGNWYISRVDSSFNVSNQLVENGVEIDDHNAASVLAVVGKDVLGAGARHTKSQVVNRWTTAEGDNSFSGANNLSLSALGAGNSCYAQFIHHNNRVGLFTRYGNSKWAYFNSNNWWGSVQIPIFFLEDAEYKTYMNVRQFGTTVHFVVFRHPTESDRLLAYGQIDMTTGDIIVDGDVIANLDGTNLPLSPSDLENVDIFYRTDQRFRFWDIGMVNGKITLGYELWEKDTTTSGTTGNEGRIYLAPRDDIARVFDPVEALFGAGKTFYDAPGSHYSGGIAFGENNELMSAEEGEGTRRLKYRPITEKFTAKESVNVMTSGNPIRPEKIVGRNGFIVAKFTSYPDYKTMTSGGTYVVDIVPDA